MATNVSEIAIYMDLKYDNFGIKMAATNIKSVFQRFGISIAKFCAYTNDNLLIHKNKEACEIAQIDLIEPHDKAEIISCIFEFIFDHPPPLAILLISDAEDFQYASSIFRQLAYTMILAVEDGSENSIETLKLSYDYLCSWVALAQNGSFISPGCDQPISVLVKTVNTQPSTGRMSRTKTGVFWDLVTCPIPHYMETELCADYIIKSLNYHPQIDHSSATTFNAYADSKYISVFMKQKLKKSGILFVDTPSLQKKNKFSRILVDMLKFAFDNRPPCNIVAVTGDASFSSALRWLKYHSFTVILATPSSSPSSSPSLNAAGTILFEWPESVDKSLVHPDDAMWVKPGDVTGLKKQILLLLESHKVPISLNDLAHEYQKFFKVPLVINDFQSPSLRKLLSSMKDSVILEKVGRMGTARLKESKESSLAPNEMNQIEEFLRNFFLGIPLSIFERIYKHQTGQQSLDAHFKSFGVETVEDLFMKLPKVAKVMVDNKTNEKVVMSARLIEDRLESLKADVIELLKMYGGGMPLRCFERRYKDVFKGEVNYAYHGLNDLDDLCQVFKDILEIEPSRVKESTSMVIQLRN